MKLNFPKWAVIAVIVAVILVVLFFAGRQFVGKAITFTPESSSFTAGAETALELPLEVGDTLTLPIGASLPAGSESVAYEFLVTYDPAKLELIDVDSKLVSDWGSEFLRQTPAPGASETGTLRFEHATIDFSKALRGPAAFRLAEVNFRVKQRITVLTGVVQIDNVDVLSLESSPRDYFGTGTAFMQPTGVAACNANDELCGEFCQSEASRTAYCNYATECLARGVCDETGTINADLNADGRVNDGDIIIIQLAMLASESTYTSCGGDTQNSCSFPGVYICENLKSSYTGSISCGGGPQ